jgi:hypothetical protein
MRLKGLQNLHLFEEVSGELRREIQFRLRFHLKFKGNCKSTSALKSKTAARNLGDENSQTSMGQY